MKTFVQVTRKTGEIKRIPRGSDPTAEMHLEADQRIIEIKFSEVPADPRRKTVDWYWAATIESRFKVHDGD